MYQNTTQPVHKTAAPTGVLVVNLGTPNAPTTTAVRRFLRQFLSDPRVVEYPRIPWWLILNLVILLIRPPRSAAAYRKIWTKAGSPLLLHSRAIADKLRDRVISSSNHPMFVELAMTYGSPCIDDAIDKLLAAGASRIIILPLYPQYSSTTTAAVFDAVARKLGRLRYLPETRFINSYHDAPGYIAALASSVHDYREKNGSGQQLLMSFHGVPKSTVTNGDPYHDQCRQTARLLADALQLNDSEWQISFQSRVGRKEWLTPYTDESVTSMAAQGFTEVDVVCPGFSVDCLETLEEIAMQNAALFTSAGGKALRYVPALNDGDAQVRFLAELVERHTAHWTPATADNITSGTEHATAMRAMQ